MKEASWEDCLHSYSSIKVTPNKEQVKSLIETAEDRIKFSLQEITDKTGNFVFEDYYSSLLEIMHGIVLLDGFKVSNHICLGLYLKDILKREDLFRLFDDCRFKRNSLVYYGKRMDFETSKDAVEKAKRLFRELNKIIGTKLR